LTGVYWQSIDSNKAINGKGVYFTDLLDYAWFYGGEKGNRANFHTIPNINDTFTVIINSVYYDRNGFKQVYNNSRIPGKNQMNSLMLELAQKDFQLLKKQIFRN
jgi:hypothetical protein